LPKKLSSFQQIIVKLWLFWHIIVDQQPFIIVMVDDHGVFVLMTKKNPISSLNKLVLIIIVIGITKEFTQKVLI